MIKYFETLNFKSIKSLHLPMRPFMVLVGPNGAGKTNVVRALELFGAMISRGTIDPVLEQGYYQLIHREKKPARGGMSFSVRIDLPQEIVERSMPVRFIGQRVQKSLFREEMAPLGTVQVEFGLALSGSVSSGDVRVSQESLTLTAEGAFASVRVKGGIVDVADESDKRLNWMIGRAILGTALSASLERSGSDLKSAIQGAFEVEEGAEGLLRLLNWQRLLAPWTRYIRDAVRVVRLRLDSSVLRGDSSFEEASRGPLGPNGEGLAIAVARLRGQRKRPTDDFMRVLSGLQRVFPRIEDVSTESTQPGRVILTFRERGISEALGPTNVSDGVLHALALLIALDGGLGGRGILAIEEPENAIHPWSLRTMIIHAQESGRRQLLFTTHSETLVDAVLDPASLYVVENVGSAGTTVTRATDRSRALNAILKESGEKLGDIWLDGTIGGVPETEQ